MEVFKPLIHEFKETVADVCFKFGLPHHWISPNLVGTDPNLFGGQNTCA